MEFKEFKEAVFQRAKEEGFSKYELYYVKKAKTSIEVDEQVVENHQISTTQAVGFRGLIEGKMGYSYTERFSEQEALRIVESGKECAYLVENDDEEFIYGAKETYVEVDTFDDRISTIKDDEIIQLALSLEKLTKEENKEILKITDCGVEIEEREVQLANSEGLELNRKKTLISAAVQAAAKDTEGTVTDFAIGLGMKFDKLDLNELAKEAVNKTLDKKNASPIPSGKYKAILDKEVMGSLLNCMQTIFFADIAQEGKSLLKGKVGELIASDKVNLMDHPHLEDGIASASFDDEGVPTKVSTLIKSGVFGGFLHNLKTAKKEGVQTTGNGFKGSVEAPIKVSTTNLYLEPGTMDFDNLCLQVNEGIYITDLAGIHSGANAITGDFSLAAKGMLIQEGKLTKAIKSITVAGNFFELLKDIEEVGSDLKFFRGRIATPSIIIKEIAVAGE